jgi:hypothetical protein
MSLFYLNLGFMLMSDCHDQQHLSHERWGNLYHNVNDCNFVG